MQPRASNLQHHQPPQSLADDYTRQLIDLSLGDAIATMTPREYREVFGVPKPGNLGMAVARGLRRLEP